MADMDCNFYTANSAGSDEMSDISNGGGWIQWFCSLEGHELYAEIDQDYARDPFNLYGLRTKIPEFDQAYEMILSSSPPDEDLLQDDMFLELYQSATDLYGLLHARYILSPRGLAIMREKHLSGQFGVCPRVLCERYNVLPVGMKEQMKSSRVKVFCPRCCEAYIPRGKSIDIDGSHFGCSFPHVFMQTYPDLKVQLSSPAYVPKIYGFKLYKQTGSMFKEQQASNLAFGLNQQNICKFQYFIST